ncbi:hypothetical protein B7P43_G12490 [Cryptotermes secundus]|uniref:Golgin subfamily A conserved domain-containing protein n=1 Tax=Cryptotermes secundus TaxID=105785 RepID=A0A2J7QPD2_9NEOP|nr:golgin subfamily A member 2 isoform X2 [Cryptotermes secundus]PNF30442.1 hypothetical protein B7P43_G12490 [Cryptotermes secundus]PNF30446.1 hypothetical protein B7P43_G12490 [Cryptotermes secundus]
MAEMCKADKIAAARKKLKEHQRKGKDSHPTGIKVSGRKTAPKSQLEVDGRSLEQNSVFDSGPVNSECSKIGIGGRVGSKLQTSTDPSLKLQRCLDEPAAPEKNYSYHSPPNLDEINEANMKDTSTSQNVVLNEVEENTFAGCTGSNILSVTSVPTYAPIATVSPVTVTDSVLSGYVHSSDIATAKAFFENYSSDKQTQPSNSNIGITSEIKDSEQVTTVHHLFPASNNEHLGAAGDAQSNVFLSVNESNPSQSVIIQNSDTATSQESIQVIDSEMDQSITNNQTDNVVTHDQHGTQNTSVLLSTPEHSITAMSSSECLRQLSLRMNGLIDESAHDDITYIEGNVLECRNQELAALLAIRQQQCEQMELQLKEYQSGMCQLQMELNQVRTESEAKVLREIGPVQEQLQLHVQTVGILVGEKTELQAALTKSQNIAKQKASEAEELQGRLKASRHRVMDLEKEVSSLQETNERLEKVIRELSSELDKQKLEHQITSKRLIETEEEISELHQKLNTKVNDCMALQQELQEKMSQLSLAQLRIQQLSTADTSEVDGQLEILHQQKILLEKQVADLEQTLKSVGSERDQANQQYQQYVQQLNGQLQSSGSKVESLSCENEQLIAREQSLVQHVSELEKQLQHLQQQNQKRRDSSPKSLQQDSNLLQELEAKLELTESKNKVLAEKLDSQIQENENILRELEERSAKINKLESMLERFEDDQLDKNKLLAAMESDKVAAARAVGQNQQLKEQLKELQDVFVKMSNDKLELTERLEYEQHICKEQEERLAQQEVELNGIRTQLLHKEQLLQQKPELSNQMLQHNQIADNMRHCEADGVLKELLQEELKQAKEHVQALSMQNSELRTLLAQDAAHDSGSSSGDDTITHKDEMLATLSLSVRQLEQERDQLLEQLKHQELHEKTQTLLQQNSQDSNQRDSMKVAMEKLEERFMRTMKEVAALSDEKQRLEHLVLQLQGETETIGEYIALYQVQRSILRQRAREKDEQLSKLSKDREELRNKLSELTELVQQLAAEKEAIWKITHDSPMEHLVEQTSVKHKQQGEDIPNGETVEVEDPVKLNEMMQLASPSGVHLPPALRADTAGKIMALLSEIGSSSLVDPQCSENFHPCPWCSGRLITV